MLIESASSFCKVSRQRLSLELWGILTAQPLRMAFGSKKKAKAIFLKNYPHYELTDALDGIRKREYKRLDKTKHVYLDYTGASLYPETLVQWHSKLLKKSTFGNTHSVSPRYVSDPLQCVPWVCPAHRVIVLPCRQHMRIGLGQPSSSFLTRETIIRSSSRPIAPLL